MPALELRAPASLLVPLVRALQSEGLDPLTTARPVGLVVLAHAGSPAPHAADDLVRDSRPHLLVGLSPGHVDLGPFVDPGLTACLHCLYAAAAPPVLGSVLGSVLDSALGSVLGSPAGEGPSASLLAVAAAFLAHDVRRWAGGHEPATWSATVRIDAALAVSRHSWLRHPHCGCTWSLSA